MPRKTLLAELFVVFMFAEEGTQESRHRLGGRGREACALSSAKERVAMMKGLCQEHDQNNSGCNAMPGHISIQFTHPIIPNIQTPSSPSHPDNLLKSLLVNVHARHGLLHVPQNHVEVLVVRLQCEERGACEAKGRSKRKTRCLSWGAQTPASRAASHMEPAAKLPLPL